MLGTVLIVNDVLDPARTAEYAVGQKLGYPVATAGAGEEAMRWIVSERQPQPDLVLFDFTVADAAGLQLIREIKAARPQLPVIALVPYGNDACVAQAVEAGVSDCLAKPVALDRLKLSLRNALALKRMNNTVLRLERYNNGHASFSDIIGCSTAIKKVLALAEAASASKVPVWIEGESGTGKELLARAIHGSGDRLGKPFVVVDCREMPGDKAEALLFGQERMPENPKLHFILGKVREADKGTLFLKGIGNLVPALQQRLLEVLHERILRPVGAPAPVAVDVRLIAAVTQPIQPLLVAGTFSQMFYRRFQECSITMPSLQERREDIALLARHFLITYAASENKCMVGLSEDAARYLTNTSWPGNIHQLARLMWQSVMLCNQEILDLSNLRLIEHWQPAYYKDGGDQVLSAANPLLFDRAGKIRKLKSIEEEIIRLALRHNNGCMTRAARQLGIGRSTLYRRIGEFAKDDYISRENQAMRPMISVSSVEPS